MTGGLHQHDGKHLNLGELLEILASAKRVINWMAVMPS